MNSTRITLNANELDIIYSWFYGDYKPLSDYDIDIKIMKKFDNACKRLGADDVSEGWKVDKSDFDEFGEKISDEEKAILLERKKEITKADGIFYCENCKYRTDEKTYKTGCVICHKSLLRMGTS